MSAADADGALAVAFSENEIGAVAPAMVLTDTDPVDACAEGGNGDPWPTPCDSLEQSSLAASLAATWQPVEASWIPAQWQHELQRRGVASVAWTTASDEDGLWGATVVVSTGDRPGRFADAPALRAAASLVAYRRAVIASLAQRSAILIVSESGSPRGISVAASTWLRHQPAGRLQQLFAHWRARGSADFIDHIAGVRAEFLGTPHDGGVIIVLGVASPVPLVVDHRGEHFERLPS